MIETTYKSTQEAQARVNEIQALYRQWLALLPRLEQAHTDWLSALAISKQLEHFYFEGEYSVLHDAIGEGLQLDWTTQGEYSVLSEDALWNAVSDKERLLWQMLKLAARHLDRFDQSQS